MKFDILTLFPEMFSILEHSIIGRAREKRLLEINLINFRNYSNNKHNKVDDYPYGGGNGMILTPQPIYDAYIDITKDLPIKPRTIYMSPCGVSLTQELAVELSSEEHIVILCGHYEGIDQRLLDQICAEQISIGDYVLTGGEVPAIALIDTVSRLLPGVLGNDKSKVEESFGCGLLEHPQYTRPYEWNGRTVPEVLISGHQKNISDYNHKSGLILTYINRPDLLERLELSVTDRQIIDNYIKETTKK